MVRSVTLRLVGNGESFECTSTFLYIISLKLILTVLLLMPFENFVILLLILCCSNSCVEKLWLCADDLNDPVVSYRYKRPKCRRQDVQMLVWERQTDLGYTSTLSVENVPLSLFPTNTSLSSPSESVCSTISWDSSRFSGSKPPSLCSNDSPLPSPLAETSTKTTKNLTKNILSVQRYKPYIPKSKSQKLDKPMREANAESVSAESVSLADSFDSKQVAKLTATETINPTSLDAVRSILSEELDGCYDEFVSKPHQSADVSTHALANKQASAADGCILETLLNDNLPELNADADVEVMGTLPDVDFHMDTNYSGDPLSAEFSLDDILL